MKTVLITGISRGIGKATAEKFLSAGFYVIGTSTNGGPDLKHENLAVLKLDLASGQSISECVGKIQGLEKKIDILINNAGALFDEDETVVVVDKLRKTLEVNLIGTIGLTEQIIPVMNAGSHIINISSSAGSLAHTTHYYYPSYKISKAALNMYTKTLALRLKDENITVSSVHPGWVKTDMGGEEADMEPKESAEHIFAIATSSVESGKFWFKQEEYPW